MSEPAASDSQLRRLFALFDELGVTSREERLTYFQAVVRDSRPSSSLELTGTEAARLIAGLEAEVLSGDPARSLEAASASKELRRRDLIDTLTGRRPAGTAEATGSGSFDWGARRSPPPTPETPSETLTRVLKSGEADVGPSI
jgi:hypothetical protein